MDDSALIYMRYWHSSSRALSRFGSYSLSYPVRRSVFGSQLRVNLNGDEYSSEVKNSSFSGVVTSASGGWRCSSARRAPTVREMNEAQRWLEAVRDDPWFRGGLDAAR